jgi:transcriptional antiterminator RfaH
MTEKLRETPKIERDDETRWAALRVARNHEFAVTDNLAEDGYRAYCPSGRRWSFWANKLRSKEKFKRQYPIFSGYIFCAFWPEQVASRYMAPHIEDVLHDGSGPVYLRQEAIIEINKRELAGEWDSTRSFRQKSPFQPGTRAAIIDGIFQNSDGTVDMLSSEDRIWMLINVFGRLTRVSVETRHCRSLEV